MRREPTGRVPSGIREGRDARVWWWVVTGLVAGLVVVLVVALVAAVRDYRFWTSDTRRRRRFPDAWGPERREVEARRAVDRAVREHLERVKRRRGF